MKIVTARKDHKCSLCGRKIPKGSRYWQRDYDNDPRAHEAQVNMKEHANCAEFENEPEYEAKR